MSIGITHCIVPNLGKLKSPKVSLCPKNSCQKPIGLLWRRIREDRGGKRRNAFHTLFFYNCLIIFTIHFINHVIGGGLYIFIPKTKSGLPPETFLQLNLSKNLRTRDFHFGKRRTREDTGGMPFTPCFFITV